MKILDTDFRYQHIALFGESGSGKTVLLSSFYGSTQEPTFGRDHPYEIAIGDPGQGTRLFKNYLEMRDDAVVPEANRFVPETYVFDVTMPKAAASKKKRPFNALRLVWFDYPGDWFEESVSGAREAQHKADTFENLLRSDIAFLMVDGQQLIEYAGEEHKYLKSLFHNYRTGLKSLERDLLRTGEPLDRFPRIWILALTKTDLMEDIDAVAFRDIVIKNAAGDLDALRKQIEKFTGHTKALSVGEDFLLLSSAKFEPGNIELDRRVGVDLILPLAAMLPFERHVRWASKKLLPGQIAEDAVKHAANLAHALLDGGKSIPAATTKNKMLNKILILLGLVKPEDILAAIDLVSDKLIEANRRAVANHDNLVATLTGFKLALEKAQADKTLWLSKR